MNKIRRFFILLLAALLVMGLALSASAAGKLGYVTDQADILSDEEEQELTKTAEGIAGKYGVGIYIVTVDDFANFTDQDNVFDAADQIYYDYQMGEGADRNGLLLLLSMDERDYATYLYGPISEEAFTDSGLTEMEEAFLAYFRSDDWMGGFEVYQKKADRYLKLQAAGTPYDPAAEAHNEPSRPAEDEKWHFPVMGVLIFPTLLAFILCSIWKGQMKSVHRGGAAYRYVAGNDVELTKQMDMFTHNTQTRVRIQEEERSSGGGGGGMSVGSHGGSGHSGKF